MSALYNPKKILISALITCYLGCFIVLDYVSVAGIPIGSSIILIVFTLLLNERVNEYRDRDYKFLLTLLLIYTFGVILLTIIKSDNFFELYGYASFSILMSAFTLTSLYKALRLGYVNIQKMLILTTFALSLSSIVAIFQYMGSDYAWYLRDRFFRFETYADITERGLDLRLLGYPVGLSLTSVALGTQLTYWLPLLLFVIPSFVYLGHRRSKKMKIFALASILICIGGIYVSQLRSGLIGTGFAITLGVIYVYANSSYQQDRAKLLKIYFTLFIFLIILWYLLNQSERYSTVSNMLVISDDMRFDLWMELLNVLTISFPGDGLTSLTRQILGIGIGWHNQVLMISAQLSFLGLGLFLILCFWLVLRLWYIFIYASYDDKFSKIAFFSGLGIIISGLFNSFFHNINYFTQSGIISMMFAIFTFSVGKVFETKRLTLRKNVSDIKVLKSNFRSMEGK